MPEAERSRGDGPGEAFCRRRQPGGIREFQAERLDRTHPRRRQPMAPFHQAAEGREGAQHCQRVDAQLVGMLGVEREQCPADQFLVNHPHKPGQ